MINYYEWSFFCLFSFDFKICEISLSQTKITHQKNHLVMTWDRSCCLTVISNKVLSVPHTHTHSLCRLFSTVITQQCGKHKTRSRKLKQLCFINTTERFRHNAVMCSTEHWTDQEENDLAIRTSSHSLSLCMSYWKSRCRNMCQDENIQYKDYKKSFWILFREWRFYQKCIIELMFINHSDIKDKNKTYAEHNPEDVFGMEILTHTTKIKTQNAAYLRSTPFPMSHFNSDWNRGCWETKSRPCWFK